MSAPRISRNNEQIEAEASAWFARVDSGTMSANDEAALREWLERSPKHREAWARVGAVWEDLGEFFSVADDAAAPVRPRRAAPASRRRVLALGAAAAAAAAIPAALFVATRRDGARDWAGRFTTDVGERRQIELPDGSTAVINTNSRIEAAYDDAQRKVTLVRGEAVFTVAHDPRRPFLVEAAGSLVRAVGTAFAVRLRGERVDIAVTAGRVQVSAPFGEGERARAQAAATPLAAGERVTVDLVSLEVAPILRADAGRIERDLSWMNGFIVFEQDTLATVVEEFGRYTTVDIVIADPGIRDLRITGMFAVGEIDALFGALESGLDLRVQRVNPNLVYISR